MRLKINVAFFLNFILLLSLYTYFYIIHLPRNISDPNYLGIPIAISFFSIILLLIIGDFNDKRFYFIGYIIFYFIVLLAEIVFTIIRYPSISSIDTIKYSYSYLIIISYFVFSICAQKNFKSFLKLIIYFADIAIIIIMLQAFFYNKTGIFFLNNNYFSDQMGIIDVRNFGIRLIGTYLIDFTSVISIGLLFSKQKYISSKILLINIFLTVMYELVSAQTRSMQLIVGLVFAVSIQFIDLKNKFIKIIVTILMGMLILYLGIEIYGNISGAIASKGDWSYYHRIDEINLFWKTFENSPLFGNGLIPENFLSTFYAGNALANIYYSDVGIIGLMAKNGIMGLMLYIVPLILVIKEIKYNNRNRGIMIAIFVAIFASMLNLSLFDNPRLVVLPLYFAIIDAVKKGSDNFYG
ncbi:hypothetical protein [Lactobacillus helveticus]|uniref:Polysaccharide polymerase n=1 Tax=Lactobacillus helveticus TaxID=1587 RepID=A0A6A7K1Z4_LACHE|nr:hypothetical protein [Lactobacillus helveticus]MPW14601.1 hypothetical protein [Lactobacillus helveticus]